MIHVQHLLGIGHLQRAISLGEVLQAHGFDVTLVSGGMPSTRPAAQKPALIQLPPLRSPDGSFATLLDVEDRPVNDAWRDNRRDQLLGIFEELNPEILLTETFPFGRRMLRFELIPLLEAARNSANCRLVFSSIRDILQPKRKAGREAEIVELIDKYYDRILVHGDPRVVRLEDSFGAAGQLSEKISYTGYISEKQRQETTVKDSGEVLVSAGGSGTGLDLLRTAIAARALSCLADQPWRILVSHAISEEQFAELQLAAPRGVVVERNRSDFASLLAGSILSVSQAGYNTMVDLFSTSTPAVVAPYAEAEELEQSIRADRLEQLGRVAVVRETDLEPASLARAIDRAHAMTPRVDIDLDGARHSAELIEQAYRTVIEANS